MPRAYAEVRSDGLPIDRNVQTAIDGFKALGYEITAFQREDVFEDKFWRVAERNPFVGSIKSMTQHFLNLGTLPNSVDYPESLQAYLGRSVEKVGLENALLATEPVFIKPVETKLFDGSIFDGSEARRSYFADYIPARFGFLRLFQGSRRSGVVTSTMGNSCRRPATQEASESLRLGN